nr:WecB/TagA/CpsF family glycosyltransferase [Bacteroidaceae bacterium]
MEKKYFGIHYELDYNEIHNAISKRLTEAGSDYICVVDGVVMSFANRYMDYMEAVNGGMFSICDSSYVPLYIKWIYGESYQQYSGSDIFYDIVRSRRYRMIFLGTRQVILDGLKENLKQFNPDVENMQFVELPFNHAEDFDYSAIAKLIEQDGAEIIWVALGAIKQEWFMAQLKP